MSTTSTVLLSQVLYHLEDRGLSTADVKDLVIMSLGDNFFSLLANETKMKRDDVKLAFFKVLYRGRCNIQIDEEPLLKKYEGLRNWYLDNESRLHYTP